MRKKRLLIIGCGDVVQRALPWLQRRFKVYATARSADKALALHTLGVYPIRADLDQPRTLRRLAGLADYWLHSAPPAEAAGEPRTQHLLAALLRPRQHRRAHRATHRQAAILAQPPRRAVYISTSGVYGDHQGRWLTESSRQLARTTRACRRQWAEQSWRAAARRQGRAGRPLRVSLLRAPGIYALDRLPTARLARGEPGIVASEDSLSNHIHAADLAQAMVLALFRGRPLRSYNIVDDAPHTMGEWFDQVADFTGLPRVARISRAEAQTQLSPTMLSYLNESRQLSNQRAKRELRWRLRYPSTADFFAAHTGEYVATRKY